MTRPQPRITKAGNPVLHLAPGTYRVEALLEALRSVNHTLESEVDVVLEAPPAPPEPVVQVQVHNKFNQESLALFNMSPAPEDKLGLANWLDALPIGSSIRNNNTRRQLWKVDALQWSTAGGYRRNSRDLTANAHSYTLVKRGKVNG